MAIIVEDGTGKADAESYLAVAEATAYHLAMGQSVAWAVLTDDAAKEAALRKATAYMQGRYFGKWQGYPTTLTQKLDWPRVGVTTRNLALLAQDTIPDEVKQACAELALRSATVTLQADFGQSVKRERVGPLEVEYDEYSASSSTYAAVDSLLVAYLDETASSGLSVPRMRT